MARQRDINSTSCRRPKGGFRSSRTIASDAQTAPRRTWANGVNLPPRKLMRGPKRYEIWCVVANPLRATAYRPSPRRQAGSGVELQLAAYSVAIDRLRRRTWVMSLVALSRM